MLSHSIRISSWLRRNSPALRRKTISSRLIDLSLYPHLGTISCHVTAFFYIESAPGCIFSTQTRSADTSYKINCWEWFVESETKTSAVTWQHANYHSRKFSLSRDLQGLNCQIMQMLLIDTCGISLIYYRMSLAWIWLILTTCWLA